MKVLILCLLAFGAFAKCSEDTPIEAFEWSTDIIIDEDDAQVTKLIGTRDGDLIVAIENLDRETIIARMTTT